MIKLYFKTIKFKYKLLLIIQNTYSYFQGSDDYVIDDRKKRDLTQVEKEMAVLSDEHTTASTLSFLNLIGSDQGRQKRNTSMFLKFHWSLYQALNTYQELYIKWTSLFLITDQNLKIKHDPDLIPEKGENGCPSGLIELDNRCCCESQCCWQNCRLEEPPSNCLTEVNAVWVNDTAKGVLVAQLRSGKLRCHF